MSQSQNQFVQAPQKGQCDLFQQPATITCQVDVTAIADLVPGMCVKMVDSVGGVPKVIAVAANTDDVFGVVQYSTKNATFPVYAYVEVSAFRGNIMYMESSAAIARNAQVMPVVVGELVATATTGKRIIGRAVDKATAANQLIRVYVDLPGALA